MAREFDLETILTITTGTVLVDDFNKIFDLAQYIYNDEFINTIALQNLKDDLRGYIINNCPELEDAILPMGFQSIWLRKQKEIFGDKLKLEPKEVPTLKNKN